MDAFQHLPNGAPHISLGGRREYEEGGDNVQHDHGTMTLLCLKEVKMKPSSPPTMSNVLV